MTYKQPDTLRAAAQAVVERWDAPLWKDVPATAEYIGRLRAALAAPQQEVQEPVAWKDAPKMIWLQVCPDADHCEVSFADHEGVTWCQDKVNDSDVAYVRADTAQPTPSGDAEDAARYRWLALRAHKNTAYERYGNGAHWGIGFFTGDSRHTLDAAIDAARKEVK